MEKRSLAPLAGALFIVSLIVAFSATGGTPSGDASGAEVVAYFKDHGTRHLVGAVAVAMTSVPLLLFAAAVRERLRAVMPGGSAVPGFAFGAGVAGAAGVLGAATVHFALADYGDQISPAAAQALNAIDADYFLAFSVGVVTLVLAMSVAALRTDLLPTWAGWAGIVLFVVSITPVGFVAVALSALWIVMASVLLYRSGAPAASDRPLTGARGPHLEPAAADR